MLFAVFWMTWCLSTSFEFLLGGWLFRCLKLAIFKFDLALWCLEVFILLIIITFFLFCLYKEIYDFYAKNEYTVQIYSWLFYTWFGLIFETKHSAHWIVLINRFRRSTVVVSTHWILSQSYTLPIRWWDCWL